MAISIAYLMSNYEDSNIWKNQYLLSTNQVASRDSIIDTKNIEISLYRDSLKSLNTKSKVLLDSIGILNKKILNYKWLLTIRKDSLDVKN